MVQWGRFRSGLLVQEWGGGLRQGRRFASGFVLTNRFTEKSDIDLVVDFDKEVEQVNYVNNFFDLRNALSAIFHREIDLLEDKSIRNPILRKNIDNTKLLSMDEYIEKHLYDVLLSIEETESYFEGRPK